MTKKEYQIRARKRLQELRRSVDMAICAINVGRDISQLRIDEISAAVTELKTIENKWRSLRGLGGKTE